MRFPGIPVFSLPYCLLLPFLSALPAAVGQDTPLTNSSGPPVAAGAESEEPPERTIYVPFSKLRDVFEKEGRGVFLPYEQFQALWKSAQEAKERKPDQPAPVDAIITSITSEAVALKDVVQVEARINLELIKKGWLKIPLRLRDAAIQSATIDDQVARVMAGDDGSYYLLIENKGDGPTDIQLVLRYSRVIIKSPGRNAVSFEAPQAPVNRWVVRIPEPGVKVNVVPMIAATEPVDASQVGSGQENKDERTEPFQGTVVMAFVGASPQVSIDWTAKSEGAIGMTALTVVQSNQELYITENAFRTRVQMQYQINRGEMTELKIELPRDQKVVNVFDPNVRKWQVSDEGNLQEIHVQLFEPAKTTQGLTIELEQFVQGDSLKNILVPPIRALDVARQQGLVLINADPGLRCETTSRTGLLQVDAAEVPANLINAGWNFVFKYAALPFELKLTAEKLLPRVSVDQVVETSIQPESIFTALHARFTIESAGIFQVNLAIPEGFEVVNVVGRPLGDQPAVDIESYYVAPGDKSNLVVNLTRKALGQLAITANLERRLNDPNLLTPTGIASSIPIAIPAPNQSNLLKFQGSWVIYSPESLRVNPVANTGVRATALQDAWTTLSTLKSPLISTARPIAAFAFNEQPSLIDFNVERRKPYVTAQQRLKIDVDNGIASYESLIRYEILYSGIKSLRIDLPAEIAPDVRNKSANIRESQITPAPADLPAGYIAWALTGESELLGVQTVVLSWQKKLDQLDIGKSIPIPVPVLRPMQVDRTWGQIVLAKSESLDVLPGEDASGLRPIDPNVDMIPELRVGNASRGFEFQDAWKLTLTATRYQLEEVKRTSIERGVVRAVITRSQKCGVQALYRLRSARQRLAIRLPDGAQFDSQPVRINGQTVALERGDQNQLFVPLVGINPNDLVVLDLRYTLDKTNLTLVTPEFPEDPAVQKVYLAAYLPQERVLLASTGEWTEEYGWAASGPFKYRPRSNKSEEDLTLWVIEGVNTTPSPNFLTDGTMYLFSTLRPKSPPDGQLQLYTMDERLWALLIFIPFTAVGLLFLRSPFKFQIVGLSGLLIGLIACGIFAPTLGRQIMNQPLYAGLTIVGIAWIARFTMTSFQRRRSNEPPPTTPAAVEATPVVTDDEQGGNSHV